MRVAVDPIQAQALARANRQANCQSYRPRPEHSIAVIHGERVFVVYRDARRRVQHYIEGVTGRVYNTPEYVLQTMVEKNYESQAFALARALNEAMRRV